MKPLVFWQNIPSIHQAPLIRAFARQWAGEVVVVTEADVSGDRLRQGWERPDFSPARLVIAPTCEERQRLAREYGVEESVHIFSGFHAYPETYRTFKQMSRTKAIMGAFMEPGRSNDGVRAVLRRLRYTLHALQWGKRLGFLLATGELGVRWYRHCGFPERLIYPFGYFVERQEDEGTSGEINPQRHKTEKSIRLLFVGQLIHRKGVDLLLHALAPQRQRNWYLEVVGEGPKNKQLKVLAGDLDIEKQVRWLGVMPNQALRVRIAHADALVLPSRYDGWGAVVNEALMAGTPVIVSDACGASDLVRESWRGRIFKAGSVDALQASLEDRIAEGRLPDTRRARIREWAQSAISPHIAADYLLSIIQHAQQQAARPRAPWY